MTVYVYFGEKRRRHRTAPAFKIKLWVNFEHLLLKYDILSLCGAVSAEEGRQP